MCPLQDARPQKDHKVRRALEAARYKGQGPYATIWILSLAQAWRTRSRRVLTTKPSGFTAVWRSKQVVVLAELLVHAEVLVLLGPSVPVSILPVKIVDAYPSL